MWPVQELWGREKKGGKTSKFSKLCAYVVTFFKYISWHMDSFPLIMFSSHEAKKQEAHFLIYTALIVQIYAGGPTTYL